MLDFQAREGRRNRRVAIAGIVATLIVGAASAVATAHSARVIKFLGGTPAVAKTVTAVAPSPRASSPNQTPDTSSSTQVAAQLPAGPAFAEGSFTISGDGMDLDRNPIEAGNLSNGSSEMIEETPATVYFYGAQDTAQWQQPGVPSQAQCHHAELSNGVSDLQFDLTSYQQNGQTARFCVLTSEGRDAYVVIPGRTIVANEPMPAQAFVWPAKIPVS
jgi:hypothetical protein